MDSNDFLKLELLLKNSHAQGEVLGRHWQQQELKIMSKQQSWALRQFLAPRRQWKYRVIRHCWLE